jgi:hypothetical protein
MLHALGGCGSEGHEGHIREHALEHAQPLVVRPAGGAGSVCDQMPLAKASALKVGRRHVREHALEYAQPGLQAV